MDHFNKGKKRTPEQIEALRKRTEERWENDSYRKHMSEVHKGKKYNRKNRKWSEESRKKLSNSRKKLNLIPWNKEKKGVQKCSEETRRKLSESIKKANQNIETIIKKRNHKGSKCWNWKGGISKIDKRCRILREYYEWRSKVFERDNWTCQTCGARGIYVTAHHIKSFSKIIKEYNIKTIDDARECNELWDINNGVTLCEECHKLTDNYRGRAINKKIK